MLLDVRSGEKLAISTYVTSFLFPSDTYWRALTMIHGTDDSLPPRYGWGALIMIHGTDEVECSTTEPSPSLRVFRLRSVECSLSPALRYLPFPRLECVFPIVILIISIGVRYPCEIREIH